MRSGCGASGAGPSLKNLCARVREALGEPGGRLLHSAVFGEAACELLGRLLRPEVGELCRFVREERARLELEQRGDEDEELAARLEVERLALGEQLHEGDDDRGDVDLGEVELLAQDEREQEVERPLEGVQIQLELAHDHREEASRGAGQPPTCRDTARPGTVRWQPPSRRRHGFVPRLHVPGRGAELPRVPVRHVWVAATVTGT